MEANDMAAMREALLKCVGSIRDISEKLHGDFLSSPNEFADRESISQALDEVADRATAALSTPPRNCDVGNAEEQTARMRAHCNRLKPACRDEEGNRCKCIGDIHKENCWLVWAQMPYESEVAK